MPSKLFKNIAYDALDTAFEEAYATWGGDKRIDDNIARELQVPVFAGERLKMLVRKVNALMHRQLDLPLDNIWRVEVRGNSRVVLNDFTMPSSSTIIRKVIALDEAPKFIRDGLSVLQIAPDGTSIEGVGKKISEDVYYIVEQNNGEDARSEGEGCD
jgi:hypothetical protein